VNDVRVARSVAQYARSLYGLRRDVIDVIGADLHPKTFRLGERETHGGARTRRKRHVECTPGRCPAAAPPRRDVRVRAEPEAELGAL